MADQRPRLARGGFGRKRDGRLLARLLDDAVRALGPEPGARGDEVGERRRELRHQRMARRRRQVVALEQRLADRRHVAEALDHAVDREQRDLGVGILQHQQAGLGRADLGDGGRDRALQRRAARDRGLHGGPAGRDQVDQIGVDEQRRALDHRHRDLGLIGGARLDHGRRRLLARRQHMGERLAHQRRAVVEQHDHRAFGGATIVRAKIGEQIGARQRAGCFGPLAGRRDTDPMEELTNNHDPPTPLS